MTHCESCGQKNPEQEDGYTICCDELVCCGDQRQWTNGTKIIKGCCASSVEDDFNGSDFWLKW